MRYLLLVFILCGCSVPRVKVEGEWIHHSPSIVAINQNLKSYHYIMSGWSYYYLNGQLVVRIKR